MIWLLFACAASTSQDSDSAAVDSGDSGLDSGSDSGDPGDTGFEPLAGFGELSGDCGVLDDGEWESEQPFVFHNVLDFGEVEFQDSDLLADSQVILEQGNLNPGSLYSEIFAFEVMARCELALLLKTEGAVEYSDPDGKKTDLLLDIDQRQIGVSVTRAFTYPPGTPMPLDVAVALLEKKLGDLPVSQANATGADIWERSILHVIAYDGQHGDQVQAAWGSLSSELRGDYGLMVTVTEGLDEALY